MGWAEGWSGPWSKMKLPTLSGGAEVMKQETRPDSESPAVMQPPRPAPLEHSCVCTAEGPGVPWLPSGAALPPRT